MYPAGSGQELSLRRRLTDLALSQRLQGWRESKVTILERKADFRIEQRFSSGLPLSVDIATDETESYLADCALTTARK
jgi:hypothetical protein